VTAAPFAPIVKCTCDEWHRAALQSDDSAEKLLIHDSPFRKSEDLSMPVDPELLEILACPNCKTKVDLVKDGAALKCAKCKRVYPIKDDIPVMLLDEATVEP
jgi:uncharacterized protein YbaR (Trm112 family)